MAEASFEHVRGQEVINVALDDTILPLVGVNATEGMCLIVG
jgi:hypothetical protein